MRLPMDIIRLIIIDFCEDYNLKIKLNLIEKIKINKYKNIEKKLKMGIKEDWKGGSCFRIIKITDKKYYFLKLTTYFLFNLRIRTEVRYYNNKTIYKLIDNTYY